MKEKTKLVNKLKGELRAKNMKLNAETSYLKGVRKDVEKAEKKWRDAKSKEQKMITTIKQINSEVEALEAEIYRLEKEIRDTIVKR